jgi:hypothetical protein
VSVKRYSIGDDIYVREVAQGNWVKHSDYQSLAAENERMKSALEAAAAFRRFLNGVNPQTTPTYLLRAITQYDQALSRKAAP